MEEAPENGKESSLSAHANGMNECLELTASSKGDRGSTVVNVLCYKSEGRWFDPSWCQWIFSLK